MGSTLTVKGLALKLGYSELWIRTLARRGEIPGTKKGHIWLFDFNAVERAIYQKNTYPEKEKTPSAAEQL